MLRMRSWATGLLVALLLTAGFGPSALAGGSNPPACPKTPGGRQSRQPTASERATMQTVVNYLVGNSVPGTQLHRLALCLNEKLRRCEICVFDAGFGEEANAFTGLDNRRGWGGDMMMINSGLIQFATDNIAADPPSYAFCLLMAALAHEAMHADNHSDASLATMAGAKKLEKDATDISKAVLAACGYDWVSHYQFLCDWIDELCVKADANPNAPADYSCPSAGYTYSGASSPRMPVFSAVYGVTHTIYVSTGDPLTDREEYTAVRHVTEVVLYRDAPQLDQDTLLVLGVNAGEQVTQYQTLTFDTDGELLSSSNLHTLPQCIFKDASHIDHENVTYILDTDQNTIRTYVDTDADGVPDTWGAIYASAAQFPVIASAATIQVDGTNGDLLVSELDIKGALFNLNAEVYRLHDIDDDGDADTASSYLLKDVTEYGPSFGEQPEPADTEVIVTGTVLHSVEVWRTDSQGAPIELLGTTAISYSTNEGVLALASPLQQGQYLVIKDTTTNAESIPTEVMVFP